MPRTYIKDGKHKSYKNYDEYKELKGKLDGTPLLYLRQGKREDLLQYYKEFLDKHNLTINTNGKIIENI